MAQRAAAPPDTEATETIEDQCIIIDMGMAEGRGIAPHITDPRAKAGGVHLPTAWSGAGAPAVPGLA